MSKKTQRIIVIVLAVALLLTVLAPALLAKATVTQNDIDNIKGNLNDVTQRKREIEAQLAAARNNLAQAKEAVELVQEQVLLTEQQISYQQQIIDEIQAQIDESQAKIEAYDEQIARKTEDIHNLEEQEAQQYQEFYDQVRWMEETGSASYLSILFEASSFAEMLDYATLIASIMDYSNRIIDRLVATQAELADARAALQSDRDAQAAVKLQQEEQRAEQEDQKAELEVKKAQLENDKAEAVALMNQIAASESEYASQAAALANEEATIQRALKEAEEAYAAQLAAMQNNGDWYWPLPGWTGISSFFGSRYIFGRWESHTVTDIPASGGTEIHAAQGGVVTYVSPNEYTSYGWYCMISHGNGYVTLYAHQRVRPIVSQGQTVQKGQVIGYVGTTGVSTGNHLHFELRVNGVRNDVLQLYPNVTFSYGGYRWNGNNYPRW